MDKLFGAKLSIHHLGSSIWSVRYVVCNESGKTSNSSTCIIKNYFSYFFNTKIYVAVILMFTCISNSNAYQNYQIFALKGVIHFQMEFGVLMK